VVAAAERSRDRRRRLPTNAAADAEETGVEVSEATYGKALPPFVLVHGGQHGGWCWRYVAQRLRAAGAEVFTPTLTGVGERAHLLSKEVSLETLIEDIVNVLECEELADVVLVGHSFGGLPVSGTADRAAERIRHLVFLDAALVQNGQSAADQIADEVFLPWLKLAQEQNGGLGLPIHFTPADLGVTNTDDAAWMTRRLTPHPTRGYTDKIRLGNPLGNGLPATYIGCNQDLGLDSSRQLARDLGWNYVDLNVGHNAMLIAPDEVTRLLLSAAGAQVAGNETALESGVAAPAGAVG
jgi:pimeloyl-ACP methyl ester carboxylesterase